MKRIIFIVIVILIAMFVYINVNASVDEDEIIIPEAAIRVRVIAHSNTIYDQSMKMKVKLYLEQNLSPLLVDVDSIEDARDIIRSRVNDLEVGIQDIFEDNDYDMNYVIHFGENYFPEKRYRGVYYEAGNYESLVVTIGEGNGDNWWCVLFPPLCLLDGEDNNTNDVEYQFFVQKLLQKVFG